MSDDGREFRDKAQPAELGDPATDRPMTLHDGAAPAGEGGRLVTEFKDRPAPADLGDPAQDRPLTLRVHPDDDPRDPGARRVVRDDDNAAPWYLVTGPRERVDDLLTYFLTNEDVADWPYTNHALAAAAFRAEDEHRTMAYRSSTGTVCCLCGAMATARDRSEAGEWWQAHRWEKGARATQSAERGDMGAEAFRG